MIYNKIKTKLTTLVLITCFFFGACVSTPPPEPEKTEQKVPPPAVQSKTPDSEKELFSSAEKMFQMRAYPRALKLYNEFLSRYPNSRLAPDALMREGKIYIFLNNHSSARDIYKYLIRQYSGSPLIAQARIEFLATYYKEGNYKQVIREADEILKYLSSGNDIAKIHSLVADSYMAVGSPINAVYFYTMARNASSGHASDKIILGNLKKAISQLNSPDIIALLERHLDDELVNGYLMYQLGVNYNNEGKQDDAMPILSDFIRKYPRHEYIRQAKQLFEKIEQVSIYNLSAIGCLLPLTGKFEVYGKKALQGIQLAQNQISSSIGGKPPVNLIIRDTKSDPNKAVLEVRKLAKKRVSVIIGPIITAEAAAREAQSKRIPMIALTQKEGITQIGDYIFRNFMTPKMQVEAIVSYAVNTLGFNNFSILYPDEKYGLTFMDLFQKEVLSYGRNLVGAELYRPNQTDFGASIRRLRKFKADALFIPDAPNKVGLIIPQLVYYNLGKVQLFGTNLWHSDTLIKMARRGVRGAIMPDGFFAKSYWQDVRDFVRTFRDTFGEKPGFIEAIAYDTAKLVFQTLDRLDPHYGNSFREELAELNNYQGITGLTSFDATGEAHKKIYLLRIKQNKFVEVE